MALNENHDIENNEVENDEVESTEFNFKDVEKHRLVVGLCYLLAIGSLWLPWIHHSFGMGISTTTHAFLDDGAYVIGGVAGIAGIVSVLAGGMKKPMTLLFKIISAVIGVVGVVITFVIMDDIDFSSGTSVEWGAYVTLALFILGIVAAFIPSSLIEKLVPDSLGALLDEAAEEDL